MCNIVVVNLVINKKFKIKDGKLKSRVRLLNFSQQLSFKKVLNSYANDDLYSLLLRDGTIKYFPLISIFDIEESY